MHIGRRNQMRPRTIIRVVVNSHIFGSIPAFLFFFVNVASDNSCHVSLYKFIFTRHNLPVHFHKVLV